MNFKKLLVSATGIMVLAVAGCDRGPGEYHAPSEQSYPLPKEMEHCRVYTIDDGYRGFNVVYCPKVPTVTSYTESCGKSCVRTVTTSVVHEE